MNTEDSSPRDGGLTDSDCEELLAGRRSDLPLGAMLQALGGTLGDNLPGEEAAMAAFRNAAGSGARGSRISARIAAASIGGSVLLIGGVAAAASGQVRHDIGNAFGVHHHHHSAPATPGSPSATSPTPSAPGSGPSPTSTATGGHQGKAHTGHGQGVGIGETAAPSHPTHPVHPTNKPHPTKKPHPTQAATPTHPAHPVKKAHPTHAATHSPKPTHTPHPTHSPKAGNAEQ